MDLDVFFKVLSDPVRRSILVRIKKGSECGCDLLESLPITQPTLSHHLKVLVHAGLIHGVKEKNKVHYTVNQSKIIEGFDHFMALFEVSVQCEGEFK